MTQYVQLSPDTTSVIAWYAGPQQVTSDKPGYAEVADDDARYVALVAVQTARKSCAAVVGAGVAVVSTGTPALNGTYALDPASQQQLTAEALYIQVTASQGGAKFTNGQTTRGWPDVSGALHTFTTTQFIAFAEAVAQFVDALAAALAVVQGGAAWASPAQPLQLG